MSKLITECMHKTGKHDLKFHFHNDYEVIFVTEGEAELSITGKTVTIKKGDILFLNNNAYHNVKILKTPYNRYVATISSKALENSFGKTNLFTLFKYNQNQLYNSIHLPNMFEIITLFDKIIQELGKEEDSFTENLIESYLGEILIYSWRSLNSPVYLEDDIISKISKLQKILENNYQSNIKIQDICKDLYISTYYLTHRFTEIIGISPKQYLIQIRLNHAGKLLSNKSLSIAEVAEKSGFQDTSNFIRCFKNYFGTTPNSFRNT